MHAGKLRHKVKFFEYETVPDGSGGRTPGERVLVLETFASVKQIKSMEMLQAFQLQFGTGYTISIRARDGFTVNKSYEVEYAGKKLTIKGQPVDKDEKHRELTFVAEYAS